MPFISPSSSLRRFLALFLLVLTGCGGGGGDGTGGAGSPVTPVTSAQMLAALPPNTKCPGADNVNTVYAGVECLAMRVFGTPSVGAKDKLVVLIHGDVSAGGPADYWDLYAAPYVAPGVVVVRLIRPGYYDKSGNISSGSNNNRIDSYTPNNVLAVANALAVLRENFKASKLVVVGHSGGGAIAATILGKYPGLIDNAALLACFCDVRSLRPEWTNSLSAMDTVGSVPLSTRITAMSGSLDTVIPIQNPQTFVDALVKRGVAAQQIIVPGVTHNGIVSAPEVLPQVQLLLN